MTWQVLRREFEQLCQQPPAAREARLQQLATTDRWLADQLRQLLQQDAVAGSFLERAPAASPAATAGQRFGRFELERPLGSGGMGSVWVAQQRDPARAVALKLLPVGSRSAAERWRFEQEVRVLASLQHPAIATFYEAGASGEGASEVAWLAMELVDGATDVLRWADERRLGREARIDLFLRLCDAVGHGHRRGVLHRDLKPANVLIGRDGALKLIDFGIARALDDGRGGHTLTGEIVGTLHFMAPEQLQGRLNAIGVGCDVYALGMLLYHLLCGQAPFPFAGKSWTQVTALVLEAEPLAPTVARPGLPNDLGWVLLRALAKEPERRYPTVDALADDLLRWRQHRPVLARAPSRGYRLRKFVRRHRAFVAVGAALLAGATFGGYGLWRGAIEARAGEQAALAAREDARRREAEAVRANEMSRETLRVTLTLFDGIEDTEASRAMTVHELLALAHLDEAVTREPIVEQAVREVRGTVFARLHRFADARPELERALHLHGEIAANPTCADPATWPHHGHLLRAKLGRALCRTGEPERGEQLLQQAGSAEVDSATRRQILHTLCAHLAANNQDQDLWVTGTELRDAAALAGDHKAEIHGEQWRTRAATGLGHHGDAAAAAAAALALAEKHLPNDERWRCSLLAAQAMALQTAGDLDAVEPLFPDLLAMTERVFGADHMNTLVTRNNQAHLLLMRGKKSEAVAAFRAVVALHERRGPGMTPQHLQALHNLGMVLNLQGQFSEAEPLLAKAASASAVVLSPADVEGEMMRFNYGACLAWLRRWGEAEPRLLGSFEVLKSTLPAGHPVLGKAKRTIADGYAHNGDPTAAARWRTP